MYMHRYAHIYVCSCIYKYALQGGRLGRREGSLTNIEGDDESVMDDDLGLATSSSSFVSRFQAMFSHLNTAVVLKCYLVKLHHWDVRIR